MVPSLGTLLDRFQGFFSKSFFIAGFLPVVMFLLLNGILIYVTFPSWRSPLILLIDSSFSEKIIFGSLIVLLVFALGLLVSSLNPWFRKFLAGYYLPSFVKTRLISRQRTYYDKLNTTKRDLRKVVFQFRKANTGSPSWNQELIEARKRGANKPRLPSFDSLIQDLSEKCESLEKKQGEWDVIPYSSLQFLFNDLKRTLETNPARQLPKLDEIQRKFLDLFEYASGRIEVSYRLASANLALHFPKDASRIGPTQLANLAEVYWEYSFIRYGLDVEKHWLQLSKFINQDTNFQPILDDAKTQLDFSVAITFLTFFTTLIWLPLTAFFAPNIYPYLAVAVVGVPLIVMFYLVVIQNYYAFTEAARNAIDLYRFDLIKALHFPLPKTLREEQLFWKSLELDFVGLDYEYEKPSEKATPKSEACSKKESLVSRYLRLNK